MFSQILVQMFYTLLPLEWKRYIDDLFSLWNVDKTEIAEFIVLANSHHPTQLNLRLNLSHHLLKGERFNKQVILDIRTHFKPTETFQYTHFSSCHPPGVRKWLAKCLSAKSFVENITQFKTHLTVRETTQQSSRKNNVRSQIQ